MQPHRLTRRLLRHACFGVAVLVGVLCAAWTGCVLLLHVGVAPVLTGSMTPTFRPGDAIITRQLPTDQVRPGQVVVFHPPGSTAEYAHRVVTASPSAAGPLITTRGDANPAPDPWKAALTGPTTPVVVGHVPYLGRLLVFFGTPLARALAIGVLGLVVTALSTAAALGPRPTTLPGRHSRSGARRPALAG